MLEKAEAGVRTLFDESVREARKGFQVQMVMDITVFAIGVLLIASSGIYAFIKEGNLESWAGVGATAATGTLGVIYGLLVEGELILVGN